MRWCATLTAAANSLAYVVFGLVHGDDATRLWGWLNEDRAWLSEYRKAVVNKLLAQVDEAPWWNYISVHLYLSVDASKILRPGPGLDMLKERAARYYETDMPACIRRRGPTRPSFSDPASHSPPRTRTRTSPPPRAHALWSHNWTPQGRKHRAPHP